MTNCPSPDPFGTLRAALTSPGGLDLFVAGGAGDTCRLLASPDLVNWTAIATNRLGPNGIFLFHDDGAIGQAQRFYRLELP